MLYWTWYYGQDRWCIVKTELVPTWIPGEHHSSNTLSCDKVESLLKIQAHNINRITHIHDICSVIQASWSYWICLARIHIESKESLHCAPCYYLFPTLGRMSFSKSKYTSTRLPSSMTCVQSFKQVGCAGFPWQDLILSQKNNSTVHHSITFFLHLIEF